MTDPITLSDEEASLLCVALDMACEKWAQHAAGMRSAEELGPGAAQLAAQFDRQIAQARALQEKFS